MLDLRRLELLKELDRLGTIAATARAAHLTPSAVSQQLATLSREAGVPLLEPDGRRVRLTAAAQLLLGHVHQVFSALEHAEADLAAFRRGDAGTVRLGAFPSAVASLAVAAMAVLRRSSRLEVHVRETPPETAPDALLARQVDVAVTLTDSAASVDENDPRLSTEFLMDDPLDLALPADHRLAGQHEVSMTDLADEDWILGPPGTGCWRMSLASCLVHGYSPRVVHHAEDFTGVLGLIGAGAGIGTVPRLARTALPQAAVVILPIAGPQRPARRLGLQYRSGTAHQPHIAPLLAALHQVAHPSCEAATTADRRRAVDL